MRKNKIGIMERGNLIMKNFSRLLVLSLVFTFIPTTLVQANSWKDSYRDYLNRTDSYSAQLIYLDSDKTPELITTEGVFSYKNGKLVKCLETNIIDIEYVPKKGILLVYTPGVGSDLKYYKMNKKTKKLKLIAHIESWYAGASSNVGKFHFNGKKISKKKFNQYVKKYSKKYPTVYEEWQYGTLAESL